MLPGLIGAVMLEVPSTGEELEIPGERFSWEEGGEHTASFYFKDHETDVDVTVNVEDGAAYFFDFYQEAEKLEEIGGDIRANDALLNHDPEEF